MFFKRHFSKIILKKTNIKTFRKIRIRRYTKLNKQNIQKKKIKEILFDNIRKNLINIKKTFILKKIQVKFLRKKIQFISKIKKTNK